MTMTGARQIVSLSSLFARWGYGGMQMTKTAYERELDRLLDACEDEPASVRQQVGVFRKSAWWI
jgi:hypothetical protein